MSISEGNHHYRKPTAEYSAFDALDLRVGEIIMVEEADGTRKPCRKIHLDFGDFSAISVGQFYLVPEEYLVGKKVVACCNLPQRRIGKHESEALILGTRHPDSPLDQEQALPLFASENAKAGQSVY